MVRSALCGRGCSVDGFIQPLEQRLSLSFSLLCSLSGHSCRLDASGSGSREDIRSAKGKREKRLLRVKRETWIKGRKSAPGAAGEGRVKISCLSV